LRNAALGQSKVYIIKWGIVIMEQSELVAVFGAIIIFTIVAGFGFAISGSYIMVAQSFAFAAIIIFVVVFAQKLAAYLLDSNATHSIWSITWYGFSPHHHFKKPVPAGVILPVFFSFFSLGLFKLTTFLTYETKALKYRAAKRFGYYSFNEMTDWHNGLIGAAGIFAVLLLSVIGYVSGFEYLAKLAAYYAFFNMIPLSKLDGSQIFFGSRILWSTLAFVTLIFTAFALILTI
jgi:Zn-dependent protease